ncbi:MAG TPA: hypothetical protein VF669_06900 [Tepidisphaeraceae bacterium]
MHRIMVLAVFGMMCCAASAAELKGVVTDENNAPAAGVTVAIVSVHPVKGGGFDDTYYDDWLNKGLTDGEGKFVIENVDGELKFDLVVVADDRRPVRVNGVDAKKEIKAKLKAMPEDRKDPSRQVRGRVTGEDGRPVWGAQVEATGWGSSQSHTFGWDQNVDHITVTNQKGEFLITGKEEGRARDIRISTHGYATSLNNLQSAGEEVHEYSLTKGATVKGRLVQDGKGVAGAAMQAVQTNRNSETFVGLRCVKTDAEGNFSLENLRPDESYGITAVTRSLPEGTYATLIKQRTATEGESDAGEIEVKPGVTLAGKIKMSDGKAVPSGSVILLSRADGWDSLSAKVDKEGKFTLKGVAPETVQFVPRVKGYRPSAENVSFEALNGYCLLGKVDEDITDLVVLMEPGQPHFDRNGGTKYNTLKEQ